MQPGRQPQPHCSPSPTGMGNTINIPITITASPPISGNANPNSVQNPTQTAHNVPMSHQSAVHNVLNRSCSLFADGESKCASSSDDASMQDDEVFEEKEHKSPRQGKEPANAANHARNLSAAAADGALSLQQLHDASQQQQPVFDRVPTAPHPISNTTATVPSFPSTARIQNAAADSEPSSAAHVTAKWLTIRVNLRASDSHFKGLAMPENFSNNLTSLRRILYKAASLTGVAFSPQAMIKGLNQSRIFMKNISIKEMEKIAEKQKAEAAVASTGTSASLSSSPPASSSPPSPPSRVWSSSFPWTVPTHQFRLFFDTAENCKLGYDYLTLLGLSPHTPVSRYITGIVHGIPFDASNSKVEQHMQIHAWYVGGVPSIEFARKMQPDKLMLGCPAQPTDLCYFRVLSTEFKKALLIPRLNSTRPLTFEIYQRSSTTICYHCNKVGHIASKCDVKEITNACDGLRDACIMCGSFEHASMTCPTRNSPDARCIICLQGKHSVRACPLYKGTYKKVTAPQPQQTPHTSAWTKRPHIPQQQSQPQPQTQPQHQPQEQHKVQAQPQPQHQTKFIHQLQATIQSQARMIETLQQSVASLQATINTLTTQQQQFMSTMNTFMNKLMTPNTNTSGMIMFNADDTTHIQSGKTTTTMPTATPTAARNKTDITKGTRPITSMLAPQTQPQATLTQHVQSQPTAPKRKATRPVSPESEPDDTVPVIMKQKKAGKNKEQVNRTVSEDESGDDENDDMRVIAHLASQTMAEQDDVSDEEMSHVQSQGKSKSKTRTATTHKKSKHGQK